MNDSSNNKQDLSSIKQYPTSHPVPGSALKFALFDTFLLGPRPPRRRPLPPGHFRHFFPLSPSPIALTTLFWSSPAPPAPHLPAPLPPLPNSPSRHPHSLAPLRRLVLAFFCVSSLRLLVSLSVLGCLAAGQAPAEAGRAALKLRFRFRQNTIDSSIRLPVQTDRLDSCAKSFGPESRNPHCCFTLVAQQTGELEVLTLHRFICTTP